MGLFRNAWNAISGNNQRGRDRRELRHRAMQDPGPSPEYNQQTMQQFQGMANTGYGNMNQAMGNQRDAMGMYRNMANGSGPSLGQAQLAASTQQTVADQQAMAAQSRGGNMGSMARQAQGAGAAAMMGGAQQASMLRAQEQQAAMQGYAGMANQMAGQGMQQYLAGNQLMGQASGQQLAANTQWGLGQRALDVDMLDKNRKFGMDVGNSLWGMVEGGATTFGGLGGLG